MEINGQPLQAVLSKKPMITPCNDTSLVARQPNKETSITIQNLSDIERRFAPTHWGYVLANAEKAYLANSPTVRELIDASDFIHASLWIQTQVLALFGSSSNRDKGIVEGLELFCDSFTAEVKGYKLSELMLFFARYKAGRYDGSWASFDARRIGNSFFTEFIPQREIELARIERAKEQERIEKRRFVPPPGYSSLSWYQELKRRAATGDQEAVEMLNFKQ